jgi:hypothetical protein
MSNPQQFSSDTIEKGYDKTIITNSPINTNHDITKILNYFDNNPELGQYFNVISNNDIKTYNSLITFFKHYIDNDSRINYTNFVTPEFNIIFNLIEKLKGIIEFDLWDDISKFDLTSIKTNYVIINAFKTDFDIDKYLAQCEYTGVKFIIISQSPIKLLDKNDIIPILIKDNINVNNHNGFVCLMCQMIITQNINISNYDLSEIFSFIIESKLKNDENNMRNFIFELSNDNHINYKKIIRFFRKYYSNTLKQSITVLIGPYFTILDLINLKLSTGFKLWKNDHCQPLNENEYVIINCDTININVSDFVADKIKTLNIKFILIFNQPNIFDLHKDIFIETPKNKYNLSKFSEFCIDQKKK